MQPQYTVHDNDKKYVGKHKRKWNPRIEPPDQLEFLKTTNKYDMEHYPGRLAMSKALTSEMQNRKAVYLNLGDDTEYKSLYGEKNPQRDGQHSEEYYLSLL